MLLNLISKIALYWYENDAHRAIIYRIDFVTNFDFQVTACAIECG